ncbi:uncharacterized protein A4U43_C07F1810 [Asparagus officinalis]|uniref:Factor of DNA methylation 1-5/IDN2 domain-containing protein n=1 Tax=Asparagus officinalis TaxID=4686 RepID=A0A5P1EDK4_ASPOF|nr:uncharacterized protein A4U43_C07F1810 [Asparagus officinalis]
MDDNTIARFLTESNPNPNGPNPNPIPRPIEPKAEPEPEPEPSPELFVWPWTGVLANVPIGEPLEERFSKFKPLEVIPLFVREHDKPNGNCVVIMRFNKDWSGFRDAVAFENQFKAVGLGREEWVKGKFEVGKGDLYGWMAREEDFNGDDSVGEYLKRNGKVLTVSEVENEQAKENGRMVALLASQIEVKNQHLMDMQCRYNLSDLSLRRILEDKNRVHLAFNEKMRRMQGEARDNARKVFEENEKLRLELDSKKKELDLRRKELDKLESLNEGEKQKLDDEKQKGLDGLMMKGRTVIGIKRMGELDEKPFQNACKKKFQEDVDIKALTLCSEWQEKLKNPSWHPFKIVESGGKAEEVIDESDINLKHIWIEWGDDVYNAVKTALLEINQYNPSGRYVIPELWNFKENRKATVKEVVQYLIKHWRSLKNKR